MAIVVSVIVVAGLVGIGWALVVLLRRMFGGSASVDPASTSVDSGSVLPYGGLPELGPVGPLGGLSPDADIDDPMAGPDDLLGH